MSKSIKIILVIILLLITSLYFLSKNYEVRSVYNMVRGITGGRNPLSNLDPEFVRNIRYPEILTKNGLRQEIENELYTGDRKKECRKTTEGKCIPEADSYISVFLSNVKKENQALAEKFFLMHRSVNQEFLKDLSISEIEDTLSKWHIARTCQLVLSKDRMKFYDNSTIYIEKQKFEHFDEFIIILSTDRKMIKVDYNKIRFAAQDKYSTKEKCAEYFREKE